MNNSKELSQNLIQMIDDFVSFLYPLGMGLQYFEFVSQVDIATCKNTVLQTDS